MWTIPSSEGLAYHPGALAGSSAPGVRVDHCARRAGPREHGRQAAPSKRDRPGGHASRTTDLATPAPPQGGALTRERKLLTARTCPVTQCTCGGK
jgi:hypothetical protein